MTDAELLVGRSERFARALQAIDAANADDPVTIRVDGREQPKELTHARMMCEWLLRLHPDADELQLLAARAHHLRRWELPRSDYPDGRRGYLRWRTEQKKRHAAAVRDLVADAGYDPSEVERVATIVRKADLGDPAVQAHEDALCLVFLDTQFDEVRERLGDDKVVDVLAKTIRKMSPEGVAAVGELGLDESALALVDRAARSVAGTDVD